MAVLELRDISKSFDGIKVIDGLSVSFERGKITGLVGPNGAGKTTLFNVISGVIHQDNGEIFYQGSVLNGMPAWKRAQLGIGRLWQDIRVFENMTILENVLLAKKNNPYESILNNFLPRGNRQLEKQNTADARHWIDFVGLAGKEQSLAGDLSYGQQKLLAIARLLMNDAEILLLDEPTSGVHPDLIKNLLQTIGKIVNEGKTVIIIEHNFGIVTQISDWVYLMDKGKIGLSGSPQEITKSTLLKEVYLGV